MRTQRIRNEELGIRNFLGTDEHGFKKDTAGLRDGNGLISLKAILKYRHGSKNEILKN